MIGAAGKRIEGEEAAKKKKTSSISAALGGTALEALGRSKAPVILVKPSDAAAGRAQRTGCSARRHGRNGRRRLRRRIHHHQKSFDMAMRFVKPYARPARTPPWLLLCLMYPTTSAGSGSNIAPVTCHN